LKQDETKVLRTWCIINFGAVYLDIINEAFH
jgi:hypothetical protein